ncbi:MAG: septal ring lytic transglycosylase RlpA family protein [Bacteroidetes bacterium]|nr:septal ring lytic transglycosylase RlpA family protein [Bacteroidota bacterium]
MNCYNKKIIYIFAVIFLSGCVPSPRFAERNSGINRTYQQPDQSEKIPSGKILLTLEGVASYYAHDFHGRQTSNGEIYDMNGLTAAHRNFPFGTKVRVTNLENNKTVTVRINDRGPFKEGRIMDLSLGAAKEIDLIVHGTARVRLEVLEWGNGK